MTSWVLWVVLSTGMSGPVPTDAAACREIPRLIAEGQEVTAELHDGSRVRILEARCERAGVGAALS